MDPWLWLALSPGTSELVGAQVDQHPSVPVVCPLDYGHVVVPGMGPREANCKLVGL